MMKVMVLVLGIVVLCSGQAAADTIKIGGSGSMIPLLTQLGKAYMAKNPKDSVEVNQKSMGQPGGIAALNAGALDIAMSASDLSPEQLKLGLKPIEIARVAGIMAVSANVAVNALSSQQLCDIYSGKIKNWKQVGGADAPIVAFTRPESDSTKSSLRKAFPCMTQLTEAPEIINLPKSKDLFDALMTRPNVIGPLDAIALSSAKGKFKALKIDGRGYEEVATSRWPFVLHNNLVIGKEHSAAVGRFFSFIKSPEGQSILKGDKAIPMPFTL